MGEPTSDQDRQGGALRELAASYGVDAEYWDWQGVLTSVAGAALQAIIGTFGVDASTPESCRAALDERHASMARRVFPPSVVMKWAQPVTVHANASGASVRAWIELEDGSGRDAASWPADGGTSVELRGDLPTGYHHLVLDVDGTWHRTHLLVVPGRLHLPERFTGPGWGVAAQLYSVRSSKSWGVGDIADLARLATWAGRDYGADFVLINPLHAAEVVAPMTPSPYLPTTRRFANPLYLAVESVPEYGRLAAADRRRVDDLARTARAGSVERIDRDVSWTAKRAALQLIFNVGRDADRQAALESYTAREGADLDLFATWCALSERYGAVWQDWPADLHDPAGAAVRDAATALRDRLDFYRWLQWLIDEQLADTQQQAREAGMALGIVHDLAVGVSPDGADSWAWQDVLARDVTVGAPPDAYAQIGQDWQQPPWRPDRLAEMGYAPLRDLFRNSLRHAGGLRVDHVIGLFRLWWVPAGMGARDGAYVHYDHEALLGVLALEAQRADAVVIGEDLGNVDPRARGYLSELGAFGTSILWFEAEWGSGVPVPPQNWRDYCLASVTTHDLPPTSGYLAGDHIALRDRLGMLVRPVAEEAAADRRDRELWLARLVELGLLAADRTEDANSVIIALHEFLALTPALLRCAAITDAVGERRTQNQPGTIDEYPNWRVPLGGPDGRPVLLDDVITDPLPNAVFTAMRSR